MAYFIYILFFILPFYPSEAWSQAANFFTNSQSVDQLSSGVAGACPNCPGFNPDFLIRHSGIDPDGAGPITFSQTITTTAPPLGGTPTIFFSSLGPGAVTDNMFGLISDPGLEPLKCGAIAGLNGLNCGHLRFDPTSQGMTLPVFPVSDAVDQMVSTPNPSGDFAPSTNDHAGFSLDNRFIWSRTTATLTAGDLSLSCALADFACVAGKQREQQVTLFIDGGAGTLAAPGAGEQNFIQTSDWTTIHSSGTTFDTPTINWSLQFNDPIPDALGNSRMQASYSGSFVLNANAVFPVVTMPIYSSSTALCRGVAGTAGTCILLP